MHQKASKHFIEQLLQVANIEIDGPNPWDIRVHHPDFYSRILKEGSLGLGESYMDGEWDCDRLDQFFERITTADLEKKIKPNFAFYIKLFFLKYINIQTKRRAVVVGKTHYDLGNALFESMLDSRMNYTCGYWKNANNLDEAQLNKLELVCQKLQLQPGMRLLDIGCGFGSFAKYAAENYDVNVVGITISKEQYDYAKKNCAGLPIVLRLEDYRDINGEFDRVVSLGMFEHVGHLNYRKYMRIVHRSLKNNGLFLLHTIGNNISTVTTDAWIAKYIFQSGMLPSIAQIGKAVEGFFVMEDWHNFGAFYDKTLMSWYQHFNQHWEQLKSKYDERFYRMWQYYLLSCAGVFRARGMQVWQIVFSKHGVRGGYDAPRIVARLG